MIKNLLKSIGSKAKQIRESNIERKLQVWRVQEAIERKELEGEAQPIVDELGVGIDDAIAYIKSEKKKEKRNEMMAKIHEVAVKIGDNYREREMQKTVESKPEMKKKGKVVKNEKVSETIKGGFGI